MQKLKATIDTQRPSYKSIGSINNFDKLELELELKMNGSNIDFISPSFELISKKPDGTINRQIKNIVLEHGNIKIECDEEITIASKNGIVTNQLIIKDNCRISSYPFYFMIGSTLDSDVIQSITNVKALEELDEYVVIAIQKLSDFEAKLKELENRTDNLGSSSSGGSSLTEEQAKNVAAIPQIKQNVENLNTQYEDIVKEKYDDVSINGNELSMKAGGIVKKTIQLPSTGGTVEGHTHNNKSVIDKITDSKLNNWDNAYSHSQESHDYSPSNHNHALVYEPIITKKTAFNKDFGTGSGQVAEGNHTHNYSLTGHKHSKSDITDFPTKLSQFTNDLTLFDGDYNSLRNKPVIPSIAGLATESYVDNAIKNIDIPTVKKELVKVDIVDSILNLTTDEFQYCSIEDLTEIVLPAVTEFKEIHLFFNTSSDLTLILPVCKWQKTPEIKGNKYYELIFANVNGQWLGGLISYE